MTTTLSIAFLAGLISFLSPCVLPLIPGYISYISGRSFDKIKEKKTIDVKDGKGNGIVKNLPKSLISKAPKSPKIGGLP